MSTYTVTLDGKTAIVKRTERRQRRRWLGIRAPEIVYQDTVIGIYACSMEFTLFRDLNKPGRMRLLIQDSQFDLVQPSGSADTHWGVT